VPVDATTCTSDLCQAGVPSNPPVAADTPCAEGTGKLCDGAGKCAECITPSDCPGVDDECQKRTCNMGTCGVSFSPNGTKVMSQTAKDCKQNVCDGAGSVIVVNDDADVPDDNNACTADSCNMGVKTFTPVAQGTSCGPSQVCDNAGQCVGCNAPSDCPGVDDECKTRTCVANVCGFTFTAAGTTLQSQTAGDCKKNVCDGSGNTVVQNDNADVPADDGNQCTSQSCNNGVPSFPVLPTNTPCSQNGGSFCSAAGACVQCNIGGQCPGQDTECKTRTCNSNTCGTSFQPNGYVTPTQVAGDCKVRQCDGAGNFVQAISNGDIPADDGNQCTDEVCNAGTPSHPNKAANTTCNQNGGSFCSAVGTCVQCNQASQCSGQDTDCQTRTCNSNTCGFNYAPNGTPTSMQTPGDCKENQCNGSGQIVSVAKNSDVPADDGNQCTDDTCVAGAPAHPAKPADTACSQNGGTVCSAAGSCVQCNQASQCPGQDTDCQTRTCNANACGFNFAASGTPTSSQLPGDCKENQCNGSGQVISVNKNTDVPPDDGNQCTGQTCNNGVPSFPNLPPGTSCNQNGGTVCDSSGNCIVGGCNDGQKDGTETDTDCGGASCGKCGLGKMCGGDSDCQSNVCSGGVCVECVTASQCPGQDTACQTRTCNANSCGFSYQPNGFVIASQQPGDCQENQCNGSGQIVSVAKNTDVPADDGNQCTDEVCNAGVPSHPAKAVDTACNQNGGTVCSAAGSCVQCNAASQCPGSDTACQTRTCSAGVCGFNYQPNGFVIGAQTPGDCQANVCNGSGSIISVAADTDLPADDGNQCTGEVCNAGVPGHPTLPADTTCNQNGGIVCNGAGSCVQCNAASQCPGSDTDCKVRTCSAAGACGVSFTAAGFVTSSQTAGDCKENQCDGSGNIVSVNKDTDVPADDGNQCTGEVCTAGVASHPALSLGTTCNQNSGIECDGLGNCVSPPSVASTTPADGAGSVSVSSTISITFTTAMTPATMTAQTTAGACTGNIQVSSNDFSQCIAFTLGTATMTAGNTIATLTPAVRLYAGTTYRIRVKNSVTSSVGIAMTSTFTQPTGFATLSGANACDGNLVISQIYGGGGNSGAQYKNDFVELHNRGTTAVSLNGLSLQYTSATGTAWSTNKLNLNNVSVPAGGFYLVQLGNSGGSVGSALPAPDQNWTLDISATNGKMALVNSTTGMGATSCPDPSMVLDFIGYGTANCYEGTAAAPAFSNTTAGFRGETGCADTNANNSNFTGAAPSPRNSATAASQCTCNAAINGSGKAAEVDYCVLQFPGSFTVPPTTTVYGRLYEAGTTPTLTTAAPNVIAQFGYGAAGSNPTTSSTSWLWYTASYNAGFNDANNDEYQYAFTGAATPGTYAYTYRFSLDGLQWTYCDTDGAGSNSGLSFSSGLLGSMTAN
jgi:hypothetical protein